MMSFNSKSIGGAFSKDFIEKIDVASAIADHAEDLRLTIRTQSKTIKKQKLKAKKKKKSLQNRINLAQSQISLYLNLAHRRFDAASKLLTSIREASQEMINAMDLNSAPSPEESMGNPATLNRSNIEFIHSQAEDALIVVDDGHQWTLQSTWRRYNPLATATNPHQE